MHRALVIIPLLIFFTGCDPGPSAGGGSNSAATSNPTAPPARKAYVADLSVLTPLAPRRATHLAIDPPGNLWFVQESDDCDDVAFIAGASDAPRATRLSSANILAAAGATSSDRGNIQSIAAGPNGEIYFYLKGGGKRDTIACLGRFSERTGAIQILAGTSQLQSESGLGRSIELARGTVVVSQSGKSLYVFVRHDDGAAMFRLDLRKLPSSGAVPQLGAPVSEFRGANETLPLTRPELELAAGTEDSLIFLDTWGGAIWRVSSDNRATLLCSIVGISRQLSLPAVMRDGRLALFAGDGDAIGPHVKERIEPVALELKYPSIVAVTDGAAALLVPPDAIRAPGGFTLYATQLQQLINEPARDSFLAFDAASGQIVRVKITSKD